MDQLAALRALPWAAIEAAAKAGGVTVEALENLRAVHAGARDDLVGVNLGITFTLKKFDHRPDGKYLAEVITGSDVGGGFDSTLTVVNSDTATQEDTMLKVLALVEGSVAGQAFKVGDTINIDGDIARGWFHRAFVRPADAAAISYFNKYAQESPDLYEGAVKRIKDREDEIAATAKAAKDAADAAAAAPAVEAEPVVAAEQWPVEAEQPASG